MGWIFKNLGEISPIGKKWIDLSVIIKQEQIRFLLAVTFQSPFRVTCLRAFCKWSLPELPTSQSVAQTPSSQDRRPTGSRFPDTPPSATGFPTLLRPSAPGTVRAYKCKGTTGMQSTSIGNVISTLKSPPRYSEYTGCCTNG